MDIEKEINEMECMDNWTPGTVLQRTLMPEGGVGWTLGFGRMGEPKSFFIGATIKECVEKAKEER